MSIIMGYVNDDVVYMATDTRVVDDDRKRNEICECNYKIKKLDNGIIYGVAGGKMLRQFFKINDDVFTLNSKKDLTYKHIVTKIIPNLYSRMKENKMLSSGSGSFPNMDCVVLLGFNGKLFEIYSDFNVCRYKKYQSLGDLSTYSLGGLDTINSEGNINRQLVDIMKNCAKYTEYIGGPYLTINTKDLNYELWEGK